MARVSLVVVAAIAGAVVVGFLLLRIDDRSAPPIVIEDPLADATIVVAVEGAVASPGVYPLPADARAQDALDAAGGPAADADLAAVNPARRLEDQARLVVPRLGSDGAGAVVAAEEAPAGPTAAVAAAPDAAAPIDVNAASAAELDALPGIGPVLAQRIVDYRREHGPYGTIDELANVEGISPRMVGELRPLVTVGP